MKGLIFTYLMTGVGALGGVVYPFIGFLVYVCFAVVRPEHLWRLGSGSFSRTVALAMLVGWALHGFGNWRFGRAKPIVALLLAYWGWMALSAAQAKDFDKALEQVVFYGKIVLPFLVGLTMIDSVRKLQILTWVMVVSMGFVAYELNYYYFVLNYNMVRLEGFGTMDNNVFALAVVTCLGMAFFLGLGEGPWWARLIALGCAALMMHVIMLSFSRGGMLALGLTGMLAVFLLPKKTYHYVLFALGVALAIRMAGPEVRERFMSSFERKGEAGLEASAQSRLDLWRDALDSTVQRPVLGLGPENWGPVAAEYGWPEGKEIHSLWLTNSAELGVPGAVLLLAFYLTCMIRLWPIARAQVPVRDPWLRDAARMVIAALFGFMVAAQFVTIRYMEVPFYVCLIGAGVLMLNSDVREAKRSTLQVWTLRTLRYRWAKRRLVGRP